MGVSSEEPTSPLALVAGRDYPRSYREFVEMFPDAAACAAYLERLRWPGGFACPACKGTAADGRRAKRTRYYPPAYGRGVIVMLRCVLVVWLLQAAGAPETAS